MERLKTFEKLGRHIQLFMKMFAAFRAKEAQYNHMHKLEGKQQQHDVDSMKN